MPQVATAPRRLVLTCSCVARRRTRLAFPSPSCHPTNALLCSPPCQLCSPWLATAKPIWSPSKSRKRLAVVTSSSSTESEQEPPSSSVRVIVDHYHRSTSGLTTTSRSVARVRSSTTSTPSPPATSSLSCLHRPHTTIFSHCHETTVVSPLLPYHHRRVPLGPEFFPGTTMFGESPPAGRNRPVKLSYPVFISKPCTHCMHDPGSVVPHIRPKVFTDNQMS
jgi:hypothetical protein